jgi:hypothetical protein
MKTIFSHREAVIFLSEFIKNPARIVYELEPFYTVSFIGLSDLQKIVNSL